MVNTGSDWLISDRVYGTDYPSLSRIALVMESPICMDSQSLRCMDELTDRHDSEDGKQPLFQSQLNAGPTEGRTLVD